MICPCPKTKSKCRQCGKVIKAGGLKKYCDMICRKKYLKNSDKLVVKSDCGRFIKVGKEQAKKRAWKAFSIYVRTKYSNGARADCYTCGRNMEIKNLQCGHAIAGRGGAVLFDEEICRPQCTICNIFKYGNYQEFMTRLIKENGIEWWEAKMKGKSNIIKYSIQDYLDIENVYKLKLEELGERRKDNGVI